MDELIDMVARVMSTGRPESLTGDAAQRVFDECSADIRAAARLKHKEETRALAEQPFTLYR
jgi:hypothetical protein